MTVQLLCGDSLDLLKTLPSQSVNCVVTSPPYWGLRNYGKDGQLGLEKTPEEYVSKLVCIFQEVWRVLRDDGTLWLNLGDSYAANRGYQVPDSKWHDVGNNHGSKCPKGLKPKDLVGIPWRVAFAMQADGWYLRSDIIWAKPNAMPESIKDRPTRSHEYIFLLTKKAKYYYDHNAIKEPCVNGDPTRPRGSKGVQGPMNGGRRIKESIKGKTSLTLRNKRSVWTVTTKPYRKAHFATFPPKLIEPCILAGCPEGGTVLDPFGGAGTTAVVSTYLGRNCISMDLNQDYIEMTKERLDHLGE